MSIPNDGARKIGDQIVAWDFSARGDQAYVLTGRVTDSHIYVDHELLITDSREEMERYTEAAVDGWTFRQLCWFLWGER